MSGELEYNVVRLTALADVRDRVLDKLIEAQLERDEDDAKWESYQCAQDTEEAEISGMLVGRTEALEEVVNLLVGLITLTEKRTSQWPDFEAWSKAHGGSA